MSDSLGRSSASVRRGRARALYDVPRSRGNALVAALVAVGLFGCSGDGSSSSSASAIPPECPQPTGAYDAVFVKKSGTCADIGQRVVILDSPDEGCNITYSRGTPEGSGCKLEQKASCSQNGTDVEATLALDIPGDLQVLSGTYTIDARAEPAVGQTRTEGCTGTYDVTYTKR